MLLNKYILLFYFFLFFFLASFLYFVNILKITHTNTHTLRYVRIRRQKQTYFIMCQPDDTIGYLKEQICIATQNEYKPNQMKIILPKDTTKVLDSDNDSDKLKQYEDLGIENECELYVVFQISHDVWETVTVTNASTTGGGTSTGDDSGAAAASQE